ncbi:helix-turn-helix domain-containing protein [Streptomyces sp. NPDC096176]|uniref:helix-turn-helix domain-containing protein n=1 Tax=Streptomyces sp. NPDC096176 TaxID=3366079 RepID=UPI00380F300A
MQPSLCDSSCGAGLGADPRLGPRKLHVSHRVADLARQVLLPIELGIVQRLERARELLEESDLPVDRIAEQAGFGTAANLRQHFPAALGISPSAYRITFRGPGGVPHP